MTKDDILSMAKKTLESLAPDEYSDEPYWSASNEELERFAALVAEKATEQANARQNASWALMCKKMVAAERDACAKVCEERVGYWQRDDNRRDENESCASAIRARKNNEPM